MSKPTNKEYAEAALECLRDSSWDRSLAKQIRAYIAELETATLSTAPTTGSMPWQVGDDTSSVQISRDGSTHKWGCKCEGCAPTTGSAPEQFPYQKTFDAIAAATSVCAGRVAISVIDFREAFGEANAQVPMTDEQILAIADKNCYYDGRVNVLDFGHALLAASMGGDRA